MAFIQKTATGWRVQIARRGTRLSRTFATKAAAEKWSIQEERAILDGPSRRWPKKTLADALERYLAEVSPKKRGHAFESRRLLAFERDYPTLCKKLLTDVSPSDVAAWRDARLEKVSKGSVQRDINLLRNVWTVAIKEWGWLGESPWPMVKPPGENPARERLMSWREIRALLRRCGFKTGARPQTGQELVAWSLLVALRTGLRAGEVLGLTGETVDLERRVITLATHKTVEKVGRRQVPLTPQAARVLRVIWREGPLLPLRPAMLDALFRKLRDQLMLPDLRFHDSRGTALTHLARKVDVMTLARISGHQDLKTLMNHYYRESAEQISARLSRR